MLVHAVARPSLSVISPSYAILKRAALICFPPRAGPNSNAPSLQLQQRERPTTAVRGDTGDTRHTASEGAREQTRVRAAGPRRDTVQQTWREWLRGNAACEANRFGASRSSNTIKGARSTEMRYRPRRCRLLTMRRCSGGAVPPAKQGRNRQRRRTNRGLQLGGHMHNPGTPVRSLPSPASKPYCRGCLRGC